MEYPVLIFGHDRRAKIAAEIFKANEVLIYGFLSENPLKEPMDIFDISVVGEWDDSKFTSLIGKKAEYFLAIEDRAAKKKMSSELVKKYKRKSANAIHPSVILAESSKTGFGNLLCAGVTIGVDSEIGNLNVLHAGVHIGAGVKIADDVEIGMGTTIGDGCILHSGVFIGAGCTIVSGMEIGEQAKVGAGSLVVAAVAKKTTVWGSPAKEI